MNRENYAPVLRQIAALEGIDTASLHLENGVVFVRDGESLTGTLCQIDTPYWNSARSTAELLADLQAK